MGRERILLGRLGEERAFELLKRRGYKILERNFRTCFGEIDAVARYRDLTVFVEIKTRSTSSLGPPHLAVTKKKELHIIRNALVYLKRRRLVDSNWRIDVVSVKMDYEGNVENIEIIENAVEGWI